MAQQGLGGIVEGGLGVGEAQVLPEFKQGWDFSNLAKGVQEQESLKKQQEKQAKLNKYDYEAWEGFNPDYELYLKKTEEYRKWANENQNLPPTEYNMQDTEWKKDIASFARRSKDMREYAERRDKELTEATKQGYNVSGGDEIKLLTTEANTPEGIAFRKKLYDETKGNQEAYFQKVYDIINKAKAQPKPYEYLKAWQAVQIGAHEYSTEREAKSVGGEDVWKTNTGKYVTQKDIDAMTALELNNANSQIAKAALEAHGGDYDAAFKELSERKALQYGKSTKEYISPKSKEGGDGGLTKDDIIADRDIQIKAAGAEKPETYKSPFSLILPTNETLNISNSPSIIDRGTGVPVGEEATQFNITGGEIHTVVIKRSGKTFYEQQLFATATEPTTGLKYNVQIPVKDIKNTIKKHASAIDEIQKKIDELNKGGQKPSGGAGGEKKATGVKWTYGGSTFTEEEWLKAGWTKEKLEKHATKE